MKLQAQGSMRTHTTIITALAIAATFGLPSSALAGSPLLSGYGGPGAGEQQLVGTGLVNGGGPGGGASGGSGSAAGSLEAGSGQQAASGQTGGSEGRSRSSLGAAAGAQGTSRRSGQGSGASVAGGRTRGGAPVTRGSARAPGAPGGGRGRAAGGISSTALGLSGGELLVAALVALALLGVAVLTRRLAVLKRGSEPADGRLMNLGRSH